MPDVSYIITALEAGGGDWQPAVFWPGAWFLADRGNIVGWRAHCELCGRLFYSPGPVVVSARASDGHMEQLHACPLCEEPVRATWYTKPKGTP